MKKIFNNPEIEIMIIGAQDIITTSYAEGDENLENVTYNTMPSVKASRHFFRFSNHVVSQY